MPGLDRRACGPIIRSLVTFVADLITVPISPHCCWHCGTTVHRVSRRRYNDWRERQQADPEAFLRHGCGRFMVPVPERTGGAL